MSSSSIELTEYVEKDVVVGGMDESVQCGVVWWAVTIDALNRDSKCFWLTTWCTAEVHLSGAS
jgi:hypothetical protein